MLKSLRGLSVTTKRTASTFKLMRLSSDVDIHSMLRFISVIENPGVESPKAEATGLRQTQPLLGIHSAFCNPWQLTFYDTSTAGILCNSTDCSVYMSVVALMNRRKSVPICHRPDLGPVIQIDFNERSIWALLASPISCPRPAPLAEHYNLKAMANRAARLLDALARETL